MSIGSGFKVTSFGFGGGGNSCDYMPGQESGGQEGFEKLISRPGSRRLFQPMQRTSAKAMREISIQYKVNVLPNLADVRSEQEADSPECDARPIISILNASGVIGLIRLLDMLPAAELFNMLLAVIAAMPFMREDQAAMIHRWVQGKSESLVPSERTMLIDRLSDAVQFMGPAVRQLAMTKLNRQPRPIGVELDPTDNQEASNALGSFADFAL